MSTFDFTVSSLMVKNPRSLFNDSDYATLAINVLAADNTVIQQYGPVARSLGNLGKGAAIDPKMSLTGIPVPDGGSLAVSFVIVNKGGWSWDSDVINALELAGSAVLGALVQGTIVAPASTSAATATTGAVTTTTATVTLPWVLGVGAAIIAALEAINILFADCDGTVVPGVLSLGQAELLQYAATGSWNLIYDYPGTDSPDGCGANSDYSVTYNVEATPPAHPMTTVPDVSGMAAKLASKALVASGLVAHFSGPNTAKSWVFSQSPSAGTEVVPGSVVNMVLSTLPQR
jgi:PASTA domain